MSDMNYKIIKENMKDRMTGQGKEVLILYISWSWRDLKKVIKLTLWKFRGEVYSRWREEQIQMLWGWSVFGESEKATIAAVGTKVGKWQEKSSQMMGMWWKWGREKLCRILQTFSFIHEERSHWRVLDMIWLSKLFWVS